MLILLGLSSCKKRILHDEFTNIAMVPVAIDWSKSNLKVEDISRVTVRVFPHDGSPAYDFVMQESTTNDVIPLVRGKYSFVIFNETTDADDWNSLVFKNEDAYSTFMVTTKDDTFKGLYTKVDQDVIRKSPDDLAVFSIDQFEVTQEMILYTTTLSKVGNTKVEQAMSELVTIVPVSVVKHINIVARVVNLVSAKKSSGAIRGAVGAIQMSTGKPIEVPVTHVFIMNGRQYDRPEAPKDGTIGALVSIFDPLNVENLKADLVLDFQLHGDTVTPTEVFDITNDLKTDKSDISISVGGQVEGRPGDRPIVLPSVPLSGDSIGIDDWDDIIVPLR